MLLPLLQGLAHPSIINSTASGKLSCFSCLVVTGGCSSQPGGPAAMPHGPHLSLMHLTGAHFTGSERAQSSTSCALFCPHLDLKDIVPVQAQHLGSLIFPFFQGMHLPLLQGLAFGLEVHLPSTLPSTQRPFLSWEKDCSNYKMQLLKGQCFSFQLQRFLVCKAFL